MIPVLAIPHLNRPDLLRRCIRSIDYPVGDLVVIQNGKDEEIEIESILSLIQDVPHQRFHHIRGPNLGVGSSWNYVMLAFSAPYWMFLGNDIELHKGTMEKMADAAHVNHKDYSIFFGDQGHSMFIQTKLGTRNVGLYDPNLFPAYNEDCDWVYRMILAGERAFQVEGATATHGTPDMPGSCTIHSNPTLRENNHRSHGNNNIYYNRKWGGFPGVERYRSPFNSGMPVNTITFDPELRDRNLWK